MAEGTDGFSVPRRLPCIERKVAEIARGDVRVRLTGTVIDMKDNVVVLDDGTGRVTATFEQQPGVRERQLVRIFGRVIPTDGGFEIQGEAFQDMSGLDVGMYEKARMLWLENSM